jgi:hypothetical protein
LTGVDGALGIPDIHAAKQRVKEDHLGALLRDWEDTVKQSGSALAAAERNRLDRQAAEIWERMEALERELKAMELDRSGPVQNSAGPDPANIHRDLRAMLPEIDFQALKRALYTILNTPRDDGCAALLLFQHSVKMGGEWCAARIRDLLARDTCPGCFRHFEIEFQPGEHIDNLAPLRRIGRYIGLEPAAEDPQAFARAIAGKLCGSLRMGSVILLELRRCDYLARVPGVFPWLIEQFWQRLLQELAAVANEYYGIKIIGLLFVDAELPPGTFPAEVCCTLDRFERCLVLEMTLYDWSRDEIRDWITSFSGLNLSRSGVDHMADTVFAATGGVPSLVAQQLLDLCAPKPTR